MKSYICSCINERSGTGTVVSKTGLMKRCHMVYSQNIHIVTLETESNRHKHFDFAKGMKQHMTFVNLYWWTLGIARALIKLIY